MDYKFVCPVWILSPKGCVELAEIGKGYGSVGSFKDSAQKYAPVFSQRDFAERYIQDSGNRNATVGSIPDTESFDVFLKNLRSVGVTLLLLDQVFGPSPYVHFLTFEIDEIIKDIQDGNS